MPNPLRIFSPSTVRPKHPKYGWKNQKDKEFEEQTEFPFPGANQAAPH
jgi:hypothetical protein